MPDPKPTHIDPTVRPVFRPMAHRGGLLFALALLFAVTGCQSGPGGSSSIISGLQPAKPLNASLQAGLAVIYSNISANHIRDIEAAGRGRPGKTLPHLNWPNTSSAVLTSGLSVQVAARIDGFIRFAKPGSYGLKINANDGVRLSIGGTLVVEDPEVHGDRFTDTATITITQAGWYQLSLQYFQKAGSASLQLYWQPPNSGKFEIVPASALAHGATK
jgi:hypothetical protein